MWMLGRCGMGLTEHYAGQDWEDISSAWNCWGSLRGGRADRLVGRAVGHRRYGLLVCDEDAGTYADATENREAADLECHDGLSGAPQNASVD